MPSAAENAARAAVMTAAVQQAQVPAKKPVLLIGDIVDLDANIKPVIEEIARESSVDISIGIYPEANVPEQEYKTASIIIKQTGTGYQIVKDVTNGPELNVVYKTIDDLKQVIKNEIWA